MNFRILAAAALIAGPAAAQDLVTQSQCVQMLAGVHAMIDSEPQALDVAVDNAGWCVATDIAISLDSNGTARLQSLRWRGSDLDRFVTQGLPPRSIEVIGEGFGVVPNIGDPVFDYLVSLQTANSDTEFGLKARWDGVQNVVVLEQAVVRFDDDNRIEASARIEGVNLTDFATIQASAGTVGLRDLTIRSNFEGWFETLIAMSIGPMVLQSSDVPPEAQVATLKQQASDMIAGLPDALMPEPSRVAAIAFVNDLPTPRGSVIVQVSADPPIGAVNFVPLLAGRGPVTVDQIVNTVLNNARLLVTWTPTGD